MLYPCVIKVLLCGSSLGYQFQQTHSKLLALLHYANWVDFDLSCECPHYAILLNSLTLLVVPMNKAFEILSSALENLLIWKSRSSRSHQSQILFAVVLGVHIKMHTVSLLPLRFKWPWVSSTGFSMQDDRGVLLLKTAAYLRNGKLLVATLHERSFRRSRDSYLFQA